MRLVRVRFEKPLPSFGTVECKEPEYECVWFETSPDAVVVKHLKSGETLLVPWSRVVEAVPERGTPRLQSAALSEMAEVSAMLDEHEAAAALEPAPEEAKHETGAVETKRRRRR